MWKYTTATDEGLTKRRDTLTAIFGPTNAPVITGNSTFVTFSRISPEQKSIAEKYIGKKIWERKLTPLPRFSE